MQSCRYYTYTQMIPTVYGESVLENYTGVRLVMNKIDVSNLNMQLNTHRILLYAVGNSKTCFVINMSEIVSIEGKEEGVFSKQIFVEISTVYKDRIRLYLKNIHEAVLHLRGCFNKGLWKQMVQPKVEQAPALYSGFVEKQKKTNSELDLKSDQITHSFASFQTLYMSIKQLKEVTSYVRDNLKLYDESLQQKTQIQNILNDIGFVSSITKEEAGKNYYREQAKRIFQICSTTLFNKFGGMVPLLDLFYLYNKKRQTCLIAPEQLLKACSQMQKVGLGARLVTYKGNIKMLESTAFDANTDFQTNFSQFLNFERGVTVDQISKRKGLSPVVVQIKFDNALKRGRIVKDDRIQGIKYYNNLILSVA